MAAIAPPALSQETAGRLVARLRDGGRALVALSGGVDSSVVASLAYEALGAEAIAVTLVGPAVAQAEVDRARAVASAIGIEHVLLRANPLESPSYRANHEDRCYHCRAVETRALLDYGNGRSVRQYLDGVHQDDLADDRPGLRAMNEAGFVHPLLSAGWGKSDVRAEARRRGLPNWDQPSDACLASRVAHGDEVTEELLDRIERAERILIDRGFRRVRVRVRGGAARIEVDPSEVGRLTAEPLTGEVARAVRALGFDSVTVDPAGYHGNLTQLPTLP